MRVLILSSSTGGGHDMRASAFEAWARLTPELDLETQILRPLDTGPALYRFGVGLYNWIQRRVPRAHHIYFNVLEFAGFCRSRRALLDAKAFGETLQKMRPDVLLSVHGSLNHAYFEIAQNVLGRDKVRCVTYCGELFGGYGFSRNWVNPNADLFISAVNETRDAAVHCGMPAVKTHVGGFLLRPEFYESAPDASVHEEYIRKELGFDPQKFILLLSASSRGANNHRAFLDALARTDLEIQVVVLCGKSEAAKLEVEDWARNHPRQSVKILPHDTNVAKLLRCVSALVARPGTGATSEAIISKCPILLNCLGGTMPQECITVKFCRKHEIAATLHKPDDLVSTLTDWMRQPEKLAGVRERMRKIFPQSHPRDILRDVAGLRNLHA